MGIRGSPGYWLGAVEVGGATEFGGMLCGGYELELVITASEVLTGAIVDGNDDGILLLVVGTEVAEVGTAAGVDTDVEAGCGAAVESVGTEGASFSLSCSSSF